MKQRSRFASVELPLLKREMIENAQRKRTYVLRTLMAIVLMLVLLFFYSIEIVNASNVLRMLGRGRELAMALLVTDLVAIYALLPAMACSAISSEREKQTLGLILISRIGPGTLIAEKFLSRLVPMAALLLITSPMLAMSYVLGGLTISSLAACLIALLTAAIQVNSAAILCSVVFRTALEAFWGTYILLAAMALGPMLLYELDLMPGFNLIQGFGQDQSAGLFVLFLAASIESLDGRLSFSGLLLSNLPPWLVAVGMVVLSQIIIRRFSTDAAVDTKILVRAFHRLWHAFWKLVRDRIRHIRETLNWLVGSRRPFPRVRTAVMHTVLPRAFPIARPVAWRELSISVLTNWRMYVTLLPFIVLVEFWLLSLHGMSAGDRDAVTVIIDVGALIIALLLMVGVTCRTFASERERQTLDLLLTTPLSNRDILSEKLAASDRLRWLVLGPLLCLGLIHLFGGRVTSWRSSGFSGGYNSYSYDEVTVFSELWILESIRYLFGMLTHAFVYLTIVKWTAAWFSLRMNSMMKSMLGTLLSLIVLCVVPMVLCAIPLIITGREPDHFPIFFFMSPILILIFNEVHDLRTVYRADLWPPSDYGVLLFNLLVYTSLALILRTIVRRSVSRLLNRRDAT